MEKRGFSVKRGLVIGKFYPPHLGHSRLIQVALSRCDEVYVLVCDTKGQKIEASIRASWISNLFPAAKVRVIEDIYDDDNSKRWANYTKAYLGFSPEYVFTGNESYGPEYSRFLGAEHISVVRLTSATRVRSDPLDNLDLLEPIVRAYFVKRICLVGAESTGKSTISQDLARYYLTNWVPEYGRMYALGRTHLGMSWKSSDFIHIAKMQSESEAMFAQSANKVLICDTDPLATSIWHERYMKYRQTEIEGFAKERSYDLYLLTDVSGVPFEQDGTRDGEHMREWMQNRFIERLTEWHLPFHILTGTRESRLTQAIRLIDAIYPERCKF